MYFMDAFGRGAVIKPRHIGENSMHVQAHSRATTRKLQEQVSLMFYYWLTPYAATARYIALDDAFGEAVTIAFHLGMFLFGHVDI